ncbi:MAG: hypothetical protein HKN35_09025 [Woeseia sp.]|nr:hypothetical protein [Woeseia sp.]MBT8095472.1 hypothetical protein [Woeseia sp.]NNE61024.1 hypothetical protein [Woeseia sp.]NNL55028.1 hypothetical protein [Woeseia sp.]
MHNSKDVDWAESYRSDDDEAASKTADDQVEAASNDDNVVDGWQQYRRWISKAPVTRTRRSSIDPSLYSWKGYRNWTEEVKRNWTDESDA